MKKFIMGFVVCLLLTSTAYAGSNIRAAYFNSTIKLSVNGAESVPKIVTVEMEGEQWGRNYISIADMVNVLNESADLNAAVSFDPKTQVIAVNSQVESVKEDNSVSVPLNKYGLPDFSAYTGEKPTIEDDGTNIFFIYEGVKYINIKYPLNGPQIIPFPFQFLCQIIDGQISWILQLSEITDTNTEVLISEVPYTRYYNGRDYYIEHNYYIETILPLTEQ